MAGKRWTPVRIRSAIAAVVMVVALTFALVLVLACAGASADSLTPPTNTATPTVSGVPRLFQNLTFARGAWTGSPTSYRDEWQRCDASGNNCVDVAIGDSYTPSPSEQGMTFRVEEWASNAAGTSAPVESSPTAPIGPGETPVALPAIDGTATVGQTLTAVPGAWPDNPVSVTYAWWNCAPIGFNCGSLDGVDGLTFAPTAWQIGRVIRVSEDAHYSDGSVFRAWSPPTALVAGSWPPPVNTGRPVIFGAPNVDDRLFAGTGSWTWSGSPLSVFILDGSANGATYTVQWQRCAPDCQNVASAPVAPDGQRWYLVTADDLGAMLRVIVTVSVGNGAQQSTAVAQSDEIGPVVLTAATVKAALVRIAVPSGHAASARALLHRKRFRSAFTAPVAGRLVVAWYAAGGSPHPRVLVAHVAVRYRRAGRRVFSISLTPAGSRFLASRSPSSLDLVETFMPVQRTGVSTRASTVRRRLGLSR